MLRTKLNSLPNFQTNDDHKDVPIEKETMYVCFLIYIYSLNLHDFSVSYECFRSLFAVSCISHIQGIQLHPDISAGHNQVVAVFL